MWPFLRVEHADKMSVDTKAPILGSYSHFYESPEKIRVRIPQGATILRLCKIDLKWIVWGLIEK
jgi:hypothetical protein